MDEKPDHGDIVAQRAVAIARDDTRAQRSRASSPCAARELLRDAIPRLAAGTAPRIAQDHARSTYFGGRRPEDGAIDWRAPAERVRNLIRAVTDPWPGAFTSLRSRPLIDLVGGDRAARRAARARASCSSAAERSAVHRGRRRRARAVRVGWAGEPPEDARAWARRERIRAGERCERRARDEVAVMKPRSARRRACDRNPVGVEAIGGADIGANVKILILGVNGFIGHSLTRQILRDTNWQVYGMDIGDDRIAEQLGHPRFHFLEGDIAINREWIEYHVKKCDVVLPLVAIATPRDYVQDPLRVFELDFEENLRIVRYALKYDTRVVFPSTSEIYGMCEDEAFNEETSNLVLGPISKHRWIYSCSKQLLDRVIWAYGKQQGLRFTLFRPFNWVGPEPRPHRDRQGGQQPRRDPVPRPPHARRAAAARGRRRAAPLHHRHPRRRRRADADPAQRGRPGRRADHRTSATRATTARSPSSPTLLIDILAGFDRWRRSGTRP